MILPDSNVWISYFIKDDSNHDKAYEVLDSKEAFAISEYVVLEVSTILSQKLGNLEASRIIENLLNKSTIRLIKANSIFTKTLQLFVNTDIKHKLSFVDISLLVLSDEYQIVSFDKELNRFIKQMTVNSKTN